MTLYWTVVGLCSVAVITVVFFTVRHVVFMHDYSKGYYIEQWEDDENGSNNINPITKATDPPLENHQTFDD